MPAVAWATCWLRSLTLLCPPAPDGNHPPATRRPPCHPPALQIAEHVLGQHRYRAPGDDGKNAGDDRYIDK